MLMTPYLLAFDHRFVTGLTQRLCQMLFVRIFQWLSSIGLQNRARRVLVFANSTATARR